MEKDKAVTLLGYLFDALGECFDAALARIKKIRQCIGRINEGSQ